MDELGFHLAYLGGGVQTGVDRKAQGLISGVLGL